MKINSSSFDLNFNGLKINQRKRALKKLADKPEQYRQIESISKELEPIKDFNLVLDKNLNIESIYKTDNKNYNYWQILSNQMKYAGKRYQTRVKDCCGEVVYRGSYPEIPLILTDLWGENSKDSYAQKYEEFKQMNNLSKATSLTKMLSKKNAEKNAKLLEEINKDLLIIQSKEN